MRSDDRSRWLNRFAWFTAGVTLLLICSGGMVTSKGVGLAVPDWPTTFGYNMFLFPVSKWVGGILFEHTHRLLASTVGLLTVVLAIWIWLREGRRWLRWVGLAAVGAVISQGLLGALRVTLLRDQIGIFHACIAQAFLGLLVFIAFATSRAWNRPGKFNAVTFRWIAIATTLAIYLQLALGATMRHQHRDLAILDFPTAYGHWLPDTSADAISLINAARDAQALSDVSAFQIWLQMTHRFGAILVTVGVLFFWSRLRRTESPALLRALSNFWVVGLILQVTLGIWIIWSNKAADIATSHVAVGATMLALGVVCSTICLRRGAQIVARSSIAVREFETA